MLRLEIYKGHTSETKSSPVTDLLRKDFPQVDIRDFWSDTDDAIFKAMRITETPTIIIYDNDKPIEYTFGYSSYGEIKSKIQKHLSHNSR